MADREDSFWKPSPAHFNAAAVFGWTVAHWEEAHVGRHLPLATLVREAPDGTRIYKRLPSTEMPVVWAAILTEIQDGR